MPPPYPPQHPHTRLEAKEALHHVLPRVAPGHRGALPCGQQPHCPHHRQGGAKRTAQVLPRVGQTDLCSSNSTQQQQQPRQPQAAAGKQGLREGSGSGWGGCSGYRFLLLDVINAPLSTTRLHVPNGPVLHT